MNNHEFLSAYQSLEQRLYAFAIQLTRSKADADDLLQETAMRAFSNRKEFRIGTNFKAWITTIMRNTFINNYRTIRRRRTVTGALEDHAQEAKNQAVSNDCESNLMMEELSDILGQVDEKYRIPFLLYHKGYDYQEIAMKMKIPLGTVKSRLHIARQRLCKLIQSYYQE
ncbi:MAG: RNA polymerase sigma factor [Bacteroidota bacterium]